VKRAIASGFEPRPSLHVAGFPTPLLPVAVCRYACTVMGRLEKGNRLRHTEA
jgi:hypothetical protein